jgi:hypothetical protein
LEATKVAFQCQDADLVGIVTDSWIRVIETGLVSEIALAINIAEQYGLSIVRGRAYYAIMIQGRKIWERYGLLTVPQRLRLLSGYHDLAQLCNLLETQEPPEIAHSGCTSMPHSPHASFPSTLVVRCRSGWIHLWKMILTHQEARDVFITFSPADLIGRLSYIANNLKPFHREMLAATSWRMTSGCLKSALAKINAMSEECSRSLPDMFVDLE